MDCSIHFWETLETFDWHHILNLFITQCTKTRLYPAAPPLSGKLSWHEVNPSWVGFLLGLIQSVRQADMFNQTTCWFRLVSWFHPAVDRLSASPDVLQLVQSIQGVDKIVGQLMNGLKQLGLHRCVNIIILADHGNTTHDTALGIFCLNIGVVAFRALPRQENHNKE